MKTRAILLIGLALLGTASVALAQPAAPTTAAEAMKNLPANQWTRLPSKPSMLPVYSAMVYAPGRNQLLLWGGLTIFNHYRLHNGGERNDVVAFDPAVGDWAGDYPSTARGNMPAIGTKGVTSMLPSGAPMSAYTSFGVCWDSKRERMVYTMAGLMAAYDPRAKKWADLKAKAVIYGKEVSGGPPVYGLGTAYDPVNDEIVMFPHYYAKNIDIREATGRISGHYGTMRYSFSDNTWRRVADTFGTPDQKTARTAVIAVMTTASRALDDVWALRRHADPARSTAAAKALETATADAARLALPESARGALAKVPDLLKAAATAVAAGKPDDALRAGKDALWTLDEDVLGVALRVEPQPRCATPLVYDSKNQCLVMFGGHAGLLVGGRDALNDTWVYDCKTRQWRELPTVTRPPHTRVPLMAYDPASGLVLLVTLADKKIALWSLDVAKGEWLRRGEQAWSGPVTMHISRPVQTLGYDAERGLLVLIQPEGGKMETVTYAMRLDLAALPGAPAPAYKPAAPVRQHETAEDDPAWIAKLKALPANKWVYANPPRETSLRGWGNLGIDPVRGQVPYLGGGHSTYQVNDPAIYHVGANRWLHGVGEHDDFVPPECWEGTTLGFRGGPRARHLRNQYEGFDGRVYRTAGSAFSASGEFFEKGYVRFFDLDRGGVWRELPIAATQPVAPEAIGDDGLHMVDPAGRMLTLAGGYMRVYDIEKNTLTATKMPSHTGHGGESRPFCYLPDRDAVLYFAWTKDEKRPQELWLYDVKANTWSNLHPTRMPPRAQVTTVEYVQGQNKAIAFIQAGSMTAQWVYSFEKNGWAELPYQGDDAKAGVWHGAYGQAVWVEKYGVFVNISNRDPGSRVTVMRPDLSQLKWE